MEQLNNPPYLKQILTVGDSNTIIADNDIYSTDGLKLIAQGLHVNTRLLSKLLLHKLAKPIDESLIIEGAITTDDLIERTYKLAKDNIIVKTIFDIPHLETFVISIIKAIKPSRPLQFKLSILDETLPESVDHCVLVAITSIYLANKQNMEIPAIVKVAYAALFLDIGLLHLDQSVFTKSTPLTIEDRKQIYAHPIVAALILKTYEHDAEISLSVMDHHEHVDGSGYPKAKSHNNISKNGLILCIAELAASLSTTSAKYSFKSRIQAILKFNAEQYDGEVLQHLHELIALMDDPVRSNNIEADYLHFQETMLVLWSTINNYKIDKRQQNPVSDFIDSQLSTLKHNLNMSGLSQDVFTMSKDDISNILHESEEILALLDEAVYKIKSIVKEVKRRWEKEIDAENTESNITLWLEHVDTILID